jgi:hypothetical protein
MREVVILAIERGFRLCAPVHDGFLVEARIEEVEATVAGFERLMGDASEAVLGPGWRLKVDSKIYAWPECFYEEHGRELYEIAIEMTEGAGQPDETVSVPRKK